MLGTGFIVLSRAIYCQTGMMKNSEKKLIKKLISFLEKGVVAKFNKDDCRINIFDSLPQDLDSDGIKISIGLTY